MTVEYKHILIKSISDNFWIQKCVISWKIWKLICTLCSPVTLKKINEETCVNVNLHYVNAGLHREKYKRDLQVYSTSFYASTLMQITTCTFRNFWNNKSDVGQTILGHLVMVGPTVISHLRKLLTTQNEWKW